MNTLGICLNTELLAPSQYSGFSFNSICVFNGAVVMAGDAGIFTHDGTSDNGTDISAYFQLPSASLDTARQKRYRKLIAGGYFDGAITISVVTDENTCTAVATKSYDGDNRHIEIPLNFTDSGGFVGFLFANVGGADFSIDYVEAVIEPTVLKPRSSIVVGRVKVNVPGPTVSASVS
jgi:hypothetical protein